MTSYLLWLANSVSCFALKNSVQHSFIPPFVFRLANVSFLYCISMSSAITISNLAFLVLRLCTCCGVRSTSSLQELSSLIVPCEQRSHRENCMVNDNQTAILLLSLLNVLILCVESDSSQNHAFSKFVA